MCSVVVVAVVVAVVIVCVADRLMGPCPRSKPRLSNFCTELTGITQKQVDRSKPLREVLVDFERWLAWLNLGPGRRHSLALVTDGPWDFINFLLPECQRKGLAYPEAGRSWVDVRQAYSQCTNYPPMSINSMLQTAGMKFEGRLHSGIDDTRNIARILRVLLRRGHAVPANANLETTTAHLPWAQQPAPATAAAAAGPPATAGSGRGGRGGRAGRGARRGGAERKRGGRAARAAKLSQLTVEAPAGGNGEALQTTGRSPRSVKRSEQVAPDGFFFSPHGTLYGISPDTTPDSSPGASPETAQAGRSTPSARSAPSALLREALSPRFGALPDGSGGGSLPRGGSSSGGSSSGGSSAGSSPAFPSPDGADKDSAEYKAARKAAKKERLRLKREAEQAAKDQQRSLLLGTWTEQQELGAELVAIGEADGAVKAYRKALEAKVALDLLDGTAAASPSKVPMPGTPLTEREQLEQLLEAALALRRQQRHAARTAAREENQARNRANNRVMSPCSPEQPPVEDQPLPPPPLGLAAEPDHSDRAASLERARRAHSRSKHRPVCPLLLCLALAAPVGATLECARLFQLSASGLP